MNFNILISFYLNLSFTLMHSEWPELHRVQATLSAKGLKHVFCVPTVAIYSALDKLLGQLGIYATWLSSIAYFAKTIGYFHMFVRHVFCYHTFSYCMKPSGMCLYIIRSNRLPV